MVAVTLYHYVDLLNKLSESQASGSLKYVASSYIFMHPIGKSRSLLTISFRLIVQIRITGVNQSLCWDLFLDY